MKFRSKMTLAYTTVAFLVSLVLGIVVARISLQYETTSQKNNLRVSARSCVTQMDENLRRMDAIMQYILSNANLLESITWLAKDQEGDVQNRYVLNAKSELGIGLSTEYIMKNCYRTVFFNQNSFLASSALWLTGTGNIPTQRLISDFNVEDVPYLGRVIEANGGSVIVAPHTDYWGLNDSVQVYSLMKALRGEGMGFLEVESEINSLDSLQLSDPDIDFLIIVNGGELLYASDSEYGTEVTESDMERIKKLQEEEILTEDGTIYTKATSSDFDLTVLAYKKNFLLKKERRELFSIAFFATLVTFSVSLIMVIFWSGVLTKPIKRLQETVENTNIENLQDTKHLEKVGASDELQELIQAYQAMTARLDKALRNEKQAALLQLQAQFDTLQAQVNPHFIYNVLNTISSRAVLDNDEAICEMCGCLGNMLRYSTNNKERYAAVKKELEYLEDYFYLLKARHNNKLDVSIDVDEEVGKQIIPKMTLQQLVENCVKHGFRNKDSRMHISVTGKVLKDRWIIQVQDNGSGISEQTLRELQEKLAEVRKDILEKAMTAEMEIGGMGIANTYTRCLLLYAEDLIFEMENVPGGQGFVVTVGQKESADKEQEKKHQG